METEPWNHNVHYHRVVLDAIPRKTVRALDVGCGQGALARRLRAVVPQVAAIDLDPTSIDLARRRCGDLRIDYLLGDFLTHSFEPGSFDVVCSVAALHHMDTETALRRMSGLLRPGGTLAIVGLARTDLPADLPFVLASVVATRTRKIMRRTARSTTPEAYVSPTLWPPAQTYSEMRDLAARALPGVRYRRHLLWRYSPTWTRPCGVTQPVPPAPP